MADFNVVDYGALGDGKTNDARSIQKAIDSCFEAGGGRVIFPSGKVFYTGSIVLKSRVDFHMERGSQLLGSGNLDDYDVFSHEENVTGKSKPVLIYAKEQTDFCFSGGGEINGNAYKFMKEKKKAGYSPYVIRPAMFCLVGCYRIDFRELTLRNSGNWALHLSGCEDVLVDGVRILNDLMLPNCDGIDPDHCKNVRIANCHIEAGDDCIVIKNLKQFKEYGPTENITITNCTLISTSAAVKIGTESVDDFRNITVSNCAISRTNRGLAIQLRDEGNVENVLFSGITVQTRLFDRKWWGKSEPIHISAFPRFPETKVGSIKNIVFRDILCKSENGIVIASETHNPIMGLRMENVQVEMEHNSRWEGGKLDLRPPKENMLQTQNSGFYLENTKGAVLNRCAVRWSQGIPDWFGSALVAKNCPDLVYSHFEGKAASHNFPDININEKSG